MKVLAIDYGTKRIGVAVSQGTLAEPLVVLENDQDIFNQLQSIIDEHKIEQLVIGLSENEMADQTRDFAQELETVIDVPFEFFDETLSSKEVEERLKEKGIKQATRRGHIDHFAAALILEQWLELQES
ncbi:MAG: Holliday junction resolvase RuvX [Candidatus Paceibacterota bacterium]